MQRTQQSSEPKSAMKLPGAAGKYAIFVCSDGVYLPFLNALLNSLDKHDVSVDTFLIHYDFPARYLAHAQRVFRYPLLPVEIKKEDFRIHEFNQNNRNLFLKQARFRYVEEYGRSYDAICLLDADLFLVTHNFINLFHLVRGTRNLIGCNERYKWTFDKHCVTHGRPIFPAPVPAYKFHCSVPIVFDLNQWSDVFRTYNELAYHSFEVNDRAEIIRPIGDMFCWNISVYLHNRQDDVVLFPMEVMTQVHYTCAHPWTRLSKNEGHWSTAAGDEVFSIHGRIGDQIWYEGQLRGAQKYLQPNGTESLEAMQRQACETLRAIQREWYDLNCRHKLNIYDHRPHNGYWETFK